MFPSASGGASGTSPEAELVFLQCGTAERRTSATPRCLSLLERVNIEALVRELAKQNVLSLVGTRIELLAGCRVPESLRQAVDATVWHQRRVALLQEGVTTMLAGKLEREGVKTLPLKGYSLARAVHGDPGLRRSEDIDLLVDAAHLEEAVSILVRAGYSPPRDPTFVGGRPVLHYALDEPSGMYPTVELHWRVHWYENAFSEALLAEARPDSDGVMRAEPAHELASLLLFYARDGFIGLRLAADIAAWWDVNGEALDERALDPLIARHPALRETLTTSARVAERTVGVPSARLMSAEGSSRRSILAQRFANWSQSGRPGQIGANRTLLDALLTPPGGMRALLRRNIFPPRVVIAKWYYLSRDARGLTLFWQVAHPPRLLARYALALLAVRGGRAWAPVPAASTHAG